CGARCANVLQVHRAGSWDAVQRVIAAFARSAELESAEQRGDRGSALACGDVLALQAQGGGIRALLQLLELAFHVSSQLWCCLDWNAQGWSIVGSQLDTAGCIGDPGTGQSGLAGSHGRIDGLSPLLR